MEIQKNIDRVVNRITITGTAPENFEALTSGGKLIFGIPKILSTNVKALSNVSFVYLIDEYENFSESQQLFINTLIREIEAPCTFRVGARLYGIKTKKTYSANEDIRKGSEYSEICIDEIFRQQEKEYNIFIKKIIASRIRQLGIDIDENSIGKYFEEFDREALNTRVRESKNIGHRKRLSIKLSKHPKKTSNAIMSALKFEDDFIIEKASYMAFYRKVKKKEKRNLLEVAESIKKDRQVYLDKRSKNIGIGVISKSGKGNVEIIDSFNSTMVAQLTGDSEA